MKTPVVTITVLILLLHAIPAAGQSDSDAYDTIRSTYTMDEFLGTNTFIDAPVEKLQPVGWVREYHNWSFNEIENDVLEYNRWNGFWDFDEFYTDLKAAGIMVCPVVWASPGWLQPNGNYRPVVNDEDPLLPYSYREIAEMMYQFAGRYGSREVDPDNLMVNEGQVKKTGLNLVRYIEDWNEQDKDWEGEKAEFKPGHYAAMASANIDGHCGTMGPLYGMKQADPDMRFVMGGLANIDTKYLTDMKAWFEKNRPDSAWPIDVINIHHYAFRRNESGISPEADFFKIKVQQAVLWRDSNAPECEIWVTEFGYDSNPYSMNRAPEIGNYTRQEVQAIWNLRTFLILSSSGADRAAHFMIRDVDPGGDQPRYANCGLTTSKSEGHEPKTSWYYLLTMKKILKGMYFSEVLSENDALWQYKYESITGDTAVYACWHPEIPDSSLSFNFKTDLPVDSVVLIQLKDNSTEGFSKMVDYDTSGIALPLSQSPLFIRAIADTSLVYEDTTDNTDTTGLDFITLDGRKDFKVFPNPVKDMLYIEIEKDIVSHSDVYIRLFDSVGKISAMKKVQIPYNKSIIKFDTNSMIPGFYYLEIGNNRSYTCKPVLLIN
ncbi:MAG: T9SS type A sorting domain-containing protein [Bacteroidales bacterium]|nr:T9SS type A sorting domain-containing protein [Bacteroidales bacterium]